MPTIQIILFMLASVSFAAMAIIIYRAAMRHNSLGASASVAEVVSPPLDRVATGIIIVSKRFLASVSLIFLVVGQKIIAGVKLHLHQTEKKFSTLIAMIRGRRPLSNKYQRGTASFFLEQIKSHRDEAMHRVNRR